MRIDLDQASIRLKQHGCISLRNAAGSTIAVLWGEVWVTQEGDRRDHVLRAGESLVISAAGLTLVEALTDASVSVLEVCDGQADPRSQAGYGADDRRPHAAYFARHADIAVMERYKRRARQRHVIHPVIRFARAMARSAARFGALARAHWWRRARALWGDGSNRLWLS